MRFLSVLLFCALALGACETEFEPFESGDLNFSMVGYIDAEADTQFVRVTDLQRPARPGEALDATVTLENLATGAVTVLRDSVFEFRGGAFVHNVWTPEPVAENTPYRLSAQRAGGGTASATFRTPTIFPNPVLDSGVTLSSSAENPPVLQQIFFSGIEKLADLRIRYALRGSGGTVTISYLDRVREAGNGGLRVSFNAYEDVQRRLAGEAGRGCPSLLSAQVFVAAATEDWPDVQGLDLETFALPGTISNVEGGVGYVGGVSVRTGSWTGMQTVFALHQAGCSA